MSANGIIHCPLETARTTLSKCTAWQTWQGNAWSEADALARIYIDALPPPANNAVEHSLEELKEYRPYIVVTDAVEGGFTIFKNASGGGFSQGGMIVVEINQDEPDDIATDYAEVRKQMRIGMGKLLRSLDINNPGLAELAETPGCLFWRRANVVGPVRTEEAELARLGDAQRAWIEIHWGLSP